jgi:signal transduction histidine kinase
LGLSLSYDIVKAHRGELTVHSRPVDSLPIAASAEAGTEFVIQLPI